MKDLDIVLASASPRRREILESLGVPFRVVVSDAEENVDKTLPPEEFTVQTAFRKCQNVLDQLKQENTLQKNTLIIACDTVVVYDGLIIGKPEDAFHAKLTLSMLSDSWHSVYSGLCLYYKGRCVNSFARTDVCFRELSAEEIDAYVATGEPMGKAGSYAIQLRGGAFVKRIDGEFNNVVGLPVAELLDLLRREFHLELLDVALYENHDTGEGKPC